ncbi:MAG: hypothetical protein CME64_15050 [Halobacteriovoraceae bacterium]|nr:hypothetical protein [Halobacteriovoraceae bacterium]
MAARKRRKTSKREENEIKLFFSKYIFTSQTLPFIFVFSVMGILFVLIRMKGIEQDYKFNEVAKTLKIKQIENKELKADRARMLSVKNLKGFAKRFNLKEPDEKHIIIIP